MAVWYARAPSTDALPEAEIEDRLTIEEFPVATRWCHLPEGCPHPEEDPREVHSEHLVPRLKGRLKDGLVPDDSRVVDENVQVVLF